MRLTPSAPSSRRRLPRRLAILAASATAALGAVTAGVGGGHVSAAGASSSSTELAALADHALDTLDTARADRNLARLAQYDYERDVVATIAAAELGVDQEAVRQAWAVADMPHQQALLAAVSQLGVPYQSMASVEGVGFDCSGLTSYAWARAGVGLTRSSGAQISAAASRSEDTAMAGDLVQYPGHVMMYLGVDDAIVHSPYTGATVEITFVRSDRSVSYGNPIG